MKKTLLKLFLLFALIGNIKNANATHVMGLDAAWTNKGNDTFLITLNCYRRCTDGASGLSVLAPSIVSDSCTKNLTATGLVLVQSSITEITPLCKGYNLICPSSGGTGASTAAIPVGIEKHTWVFKVYLGDTFTNCCWYKIRWQLCCRSSNITTGMADADFIQECWLNRCVTNNSPTFTSDLLSIKMTGKDYVYNLGMVDEEQDSLSYALSQPLGGSYSSPWTFTYPLTCLGGNNPNPNASPPTGFNLDPVTGDVVFRGMASQVSVVKITVREWRKINGVMKVIGLATRDMQISVIATNGNKLPAVVASTNTFTACAGNQLCIDMSTTDQDITDTTTISSNATKVFPNAAFNTTSDTAKRAAATFCWTPDSSYARSRPYYFHVKVADNSCPLNNVIYKTFAIYVNPKFNVVAKTVKLSCTDYQLIATNSSAISTRKWQVYKGTTLQDSFLNKDTILNYRFKSTGTFYVKYSSSNSGCAYSFTDTIVITNATVLLVNNTRDTTICKGSSITLNALPLNGLAPYTYKWFLNNSLISTAQNITVSPNTKSNYILEIYSGDTCKMSNKDTITVSVDSVGLKVAPLPDVYNLCYGMPLVVSPVVQTGKTPLQYQWIKDAIVISTASTLNLANPDTGYYFLTIRSSNNCFNQIKDSFNVKIDYTRLSVDSVHDTTVCKGGYCNITPKLKSYKTYAVFWWYSYNGLLLSNATSFSVNTNVSATYILNVTSADDCYNPFVDTFTVTVDTSQLKVKSPISDTVLCAGKPLNAAAYVLSGKAPLQYAWYQGGNLLSNAATIIPNTDADYVLRIISSDNCRNFFEDTFHVTLDTVALKFSMLKDSTVCPGSPIKFTPNIISGKPPFNYKWYLNTTLISTTPTVTFSTASSVNCILVVTSADNCANVWRDTALVSVDTKRLSVVPFKDTTVCTGANFIFGPQVNSGTPPYIYEWYKNGVFNSGAPAITIVTDDTATYVMDMISADACRNHFRDTFKLGLFPIRQITISASTNNIFQGQKLVLKSNGKNTFQWSGTGILSNWNDSVSVQPTTTTTYTLISENKFGCKDTAQFVVNVSVGISSGQNTLAAFEIYPNPAKGFVTIQCNCNTVFNYQILNILGEKVQEGSLQHPAENIDIKALPAGVYFIQSGEMVRKLVKN